MPAQAATNAATKAKPVPDGFRTVTPHLVCAGAADAIEFYKRAFGATEMFRLPGPDGRLMHASVMIGNSMVMLVDEMKEMDSLGPKARGGTPVSIHLQVEDADAWFARAVAAGASVRMPLADMFWGDRYGMVIDPFGHAWSIATHMRDLTPDEITAAGVEAMKNFQGCPDQRKA